MIRNLDTQALRTFTTVAETASMTRAAAQLHLTQGAISQQIKRLEEQFQAPLFIRARRGLRLTEAGERLFGKARRLLSLNDTIWSEMTDTGCDGRVSFGIPLDLIAADAIPRLLRSFVERHANVELSVVCAPTAELKERVETGQVDLAVLEEQGGDQAGTTLFADRLVWIGAKGGRASALTPLPLSMTSPSCVFRPHVFEALDAAERPWRSVFESGSREATLAMIRMDLAVGVVLASTAPWDVTALPTEAALPELPTFNVTLALGNNVSRQAGMLADHIHRNLASRDGPGGTNRPPVEAI